MKKRVIQFLTLCLVSTFTFSFSAGQTIPGIHLGRLEFVRPPEGLSNDMRELRVTMPQNRGITSSFAHKVGGVSFVQVAQPAFKVDYGFAIIFDQNNNSAHAIINGKKYQIPLEAWQLKPIVAYANSNYNAAVTLFGDRTYSNSGQSYTLRTLFHDAFIDKLLGIRLLQTDLLLAHTFGNIFNYILFTPNEKYSLPTFNGYDSPILSNYESLHYNPMKKNFISMSENAQEQINNTIDKYGGFSSYIFTDFVDSLTGDPIKFNVKHGRLELEGLPYYCFLDIDENQIDTIETLINFFEEIESEHNFWSPILFQKSESPKCHEIREQIKKGDYNEALTLFKKYYNHISDFFQATSIFNEKRNSLFEFMDKYGKNYSPSSESQQCLLSIIDSIKNDKFNKIDDHGILSILSIDKYNLSENKVVELAELWKTIIWIDGKDETVINNFPSYDDYLIYYFYWHRIPKTIRLTELTNALKKKQKLVRDINPIVYDAAVTTCQWVAFFRYAKEKASKENWDSFVDLVSKLQDDAPKVYTPIDIKKR